MAPEALWPVWLLLAARVVPVVVWLPVFGGAAMPLALRLGLGAGLTSFFAFGGWGALSAGVWGPALSATLAGGFGAPGFLRFVLLLVRELAVGVGFAFLSWLVFAAAEMAGRLIDLARRADAQGLANPLSPGEEGGGMGAVYTLLAALLFCELGGPAHLAGALLQSYELLPIGPGGGQPQALLPLVARTMAGSVEVAVAVAAPVLVAVWLSELALSIVSRLWGGQGSRGLAGLAADATPLLGLGALLLGLGFVRAALEGWLLQIPGLVLRSAELWARG